MRPRLVPAIFAAMSQPSIQNLDRLVEYSPVATAGPFPIPFPIFDPAGQDLSVGLNGETATGWTFQGEMVPGFYGSPTTWINGSISFASPITGALWIDGDRAPRRVSQFQEGRGVPAKDLNIELNILTAVARELWTKVRRIIVWLRGHDAQLVTIENRLDDHDTHLAAHDGALAAVGTRLDGHDQHLAVIDTRLDVHDRIVPDAIAARDQARLWAEQPYGVPVPPGGYSALHWQEVAHQWATETAVLAGLVGATIYDFNLPGAPVGDEDWNNPT